MECSREDASISPFCKPSLRSSDQETLLKILKCPVCGLVAKPPIFTCAGIQHIFCGECHTHATQCPICETEISNSKCTYVEECIDEINLQCKYQNEGCQLILKATGYRFHLDTCPYRELDCFFPDCSKTLRFREFFNHLKFAHGNIVNGVENSSVHAVEFWIEGLTPADPARWPPYYFTCFNNVFLYTAMSTRHGMWEWAAILADDEEASRFQVTSRLASVDKKSELIWRGPVHSIRQSPADINRSGLCFVTNSKEMRNPYMYQKRNSPRHFWLSFIEIRQIKPPNPGSIPYLITAEPVARESPMASYIMGMWDSPAPIQNSSSFTSSDLKNVTSSTESSHSSDRQSNNSLTGRRSTPRPTLSYIEDPNNPVKLEHEPENQSTKAALALLEDTQNPSPKLVENFDTISKLQAPGVVNFNEQPSFDNPQKEPPPLPAQPGRSSLNLANFTPSTISIHSDHPPPVTGNDTFDSERQFKAAPITAEEWNSRRNSPPITTEIDAMPNPPATGIEIYDPNRRVSLFETDPNDWDLRESGIAIAAANLTTNQPKVYDSKRWDADKPTTSANFDSANQPNAEHWNQRDISDSTADFNQSPPNPMNSYGPGPNPSDKNFSPLVIASSANNPDAGTKQVTKNNQMSPKFANGIQQNISSNKPVAKITHIRSTQTVAVRISAQQVPANISATSEPYSIIIPSGGKQTTTSDAKNMTAVFQDTVVGIQNVTAPVPGNLSYRGNPPLKSAITNGSYPGNPPPMPTSTNQGVLNQSPNIGENPNGSSSSVPQPRRNPTSFKVGELEADRYMRSDNTK